MTIKANTIINITGLWFHCSFSGELAFLLDHYYFFQLLSLGVYMADHLPPSYSMPSINFLCNHPLFLLPDSSIFKVICPLFLLYTCPNHINLACLTLSPNHLTLTCPSVFSPSSQASMCGMWGATGTLTSSVHTVL